MYKFCKKKKRIGQTGKTLVGMVGRVSSPSTLFTSLVRSERIFAGFVGSGQKKMVKFHVRKLPFMFPVVVVLRFIR